MTTSPAYPQAADHQPAAQSTDSALAHTIRLLARLGRERFFGKVTISFQEGKIATIYKEECLKPADLT
jgi:hypothetical protein